MVGLIQVSLGSGHWTLLAHPWLVKVLWARPPQPIILLPLFPSPNPLIPNIHPPTPLWAPLPSLPSPPSSPFPPPSRGQSHRGGSSNKLPGTAPLKWAKSKRKGGAGLVAPSTPCKEQRLWWIWNEFVLLDTMSPRISLCLVDIFTSTSCWH